MVEVMGVVVLSSFQLRVLVSRGARQTGIRADPSPCLEPRLCYVVFSLFITNVSSRYEADGS